MSRSEAKTKTKQPKRIKAWVNQYRPRKHLSNLVFHTSPVVAKQEASSDPLRVAVPLIELRRGEVVVDVEALVAAFRDEYDRSLCDPIDDLRAAIKKVGVR